MKRFGLVIVGDEILSGRRTDKHLSKVIELLTARGLELSWAQYVGDDRTAIAAVLARTFATTTWCSSPAASARRPTTRRARQPPRRAASRSRSIPRPPS